MKYKLLAIDLDHTLLREDMTCSDRTYTAIDAAASAGAVISIATGRAYRGIMALGPLPRFNGPIICSGGAEIRGTDGSILSRQYPESEDVQALLRFAREHGVHAQVYINGEYCFERAGKWSEYYKRFYTTDGLEIPDLSERSDIVTEKVLFATEPEHALALREELREAFPHLTVLRSQDMFVECFHGSATKGNAVEKVAGMIGADNEHTAAFGDSDVDVSMMRWAGMAVAVSNGNSEAKAAANMIAPSNEEDGVALIIEKMLREEI